MLEELEQLMKADPFHAFKIVLTSGNEYAITNPLQLAIGKTTISFYYPKTDKMAHLRINQIAAIEASTVPGGQA